MNARRPFFLPAMALLLCSTSGLLARDASAQQDVDTQVRALMRLGEEALAAKRFTEAEVAYEKAYNLKPGFDVAANLGDAERELNKFAEAAGHYAFAIRNYPSSFDQKVKKSLQSALAKVQTKVATVAVTVSHTRATIRIDGAEAGKTPLQDPLFLSPGSHLIEARFNDMMASQQVSAEAGSLQSVSLNLEPVPQIGDGRQESVVGPAAFGVGIGTFTVGIGLGIAFTAVANGNADDAAAATVDTPAHEDSQNAQQTFANAALWSFVGAGAGAAVAGIGAYLWHGDGNDDKRASVRIMPWMTGASGGATLTGRW